MAEYPAPWDLNGYGYILVYRFPRDFSLKNAFIPEEDKACFAGGFGCVMLVNYENSNAGPYKELLFIPGRLKKPEGKFYSITKIYVSTKESVENGRANWGIPKELAAASFDSIRQNEEQVSFIKDGRQFFRATLQARGLKFPLNTGIIPGILYQKMNDKVFYTRFKGKGWARLASLKEVYCDPDFFPDLSAVKPLLAVKVESFRITFPPAVIREG